jgi:hypothetical protein
MLVEVLWCDRKQLRITVELGDAVIAQDHIAPASAIP